MLKTVSHDLRSPLNAILLNVDRLLGRNFDDEADLRRALERIKTSARTMNNKLEQLDQVRDELENRG